MSDPQNRSRSPRRRLLAAMQILAAAVLVGVVVANPAEVNSAATVTGVNPPAPATIEPDGTLDSGFDAGNITNGQVWSSALQQTENS